MRVGKIGNRDVTLLMNEVGGGGWRACREVVVDRRCYENTILL